MADQIVVMSQGRAEQVGLPQEIYSRPANSFVASFIGKANFLAGEAVAGGFRVGDFTLTAARARGFAAGSPVTLAMRPENAVIGEDGVNSLPAEITFIRDVGSTRDIYLRTPVGELIVEYGAGEKLRPVAVGDSVPLHLPPAELHVFPRDAEAAE